MGAEVVSVARFRADLSMMKAMNTIICCVNYLLVGGMIAGCWRWKRKMKNEK